MHFFLKAAHLCSGAKKAHRKQRSNENRRRRFCPAGIPNPTGMVFATLWFTKNYLYSENSCKHLFFRLLQIGKKRSDVVRIISDIIFSMSYVVFPTSDVVLGSFGKTADLGYCDNCMGVWRTPMAPPSKPHQRKTQTTARFRCASLRWCKLMTDAFCA